MGGNVLGGSSFDPFAGARQSASDRAAAELFSATGLSGLTHKMMFTIVYSQVFFIGGFGANFYELEETQGTIWRVETRDADGTTNRVEAERALLKKLPNGDQWWYLAWRVDGDEMEYEALMSKDLYAKKIRYFNPDLKRVEEAVFNEPGKGNEDTEPPAATGTIAFNDIGAHVKGQETISVNAGSFNTNRIEWSLVDEDNVTYKYIWWVDPRASGGIIKYDWSKSGSRERVTGELYSVKKGYTTKFSSF